MRFLGAFSALCWLSMVTYSSCQLCATSKAGCYVKNDAITADELINNRDQNSPKYDGNLIEWGNYSGFIQSLLCRCKTAAQASPKNFQFIVIRFYGLCLGALALPSGVPTGTDCIESWEVTPSSLTTCRDSSALSCVGQETTDYYYRLGINGGFTQWATWTACSTTCGQGVQRSTRTCTAPAPSGNGLPCSGSPTQTKACTAANCPVDGGFSAWSSWGSCSKTCGGGVRTQTRTCTNPAPQNVGLPCDGFFSQSQACNPQVCPVHGNWGNWGTFVSCTQTCGGGTVARSRVCNNPSPSNGGNACAGASTETKGCVNSLCPGVDAITKSQELVETFLREYHTTTFPGIPITGRFSQAIFSLQQSVATEVASMDPDVINKTPEQRLSDLTDLLNAAIKGNSIDFARSMFGKTFFSLIQSQVNQGLALDSMNEAAARFMAQIKSTIGNTSYDGLINSLGDVTLMFTMDTTGSMREEIDAAKAIATMIVNENRTNPVDYILSPYSDPTTGPVTVYTSAQKEQFVKAIGELPSRGGLDCEELAFKGMMDALDAGPKFRSPMYVFTDANAKDKSLMRNLNALAAANSAKINFFVENMVCGTSVYEEYREVARFTSGQVLPLVASSDLINYSLSVRNSLKTDTNVAGGGSNSTVSRRRRRRRSLDAGIYDVRVDDELSTIAITVSVRTFGQSRGVILRSPTGNVEKPKTLTSFVAIYQVDNPELGKWQLDFTAVTSEYDFKAEAVAKKPVDFAVTFLYQMTKYSPVFPISHPRSGEQASVVLQTTGSEAIDGDSLRVSLLDEESVPLEIFYEVQQRPGHSVYKATFIPPSHPFKVAIVGKTMKGNPFQRVSQELYKPSPYLLRALYAGKEFSCKIGSDAPVVLQMMATEKREGFKFTFKAMRGVFHPVSLTKWVRRTRGISVMYHAPKDASLVGKTDILQIFVENLKTKQSTDLVFKMLLT